MGDQPGGGIEQEHTVSPHLDTPRQVWHNQATGVPKGYRQQGIKDGMQIRKQGLFPPEDPLLQELQDEPDCRPFDKHLAGLQSSYELLPHGSFVSGDDAAAGRGIDLRLFYKDAEGYEDYGTVVGAVRLGEKASIGQGYWMTAHGGAIEAILDEVTAELAKCEFSPTLSTTEANFKLKKPVPLHTTLRVQAEIQNVKGVRCWVTGSIKDLDGLLLASCEAQVTDVRSITKQEAERLKQAGK